MTQQERIEWHLDRRVTLTLIAGLFAQALGLGLWAGVLQSRVDENTLKIGRIEERQRTNVEMAARLEERLIAQGGTLNRIERLLEQMTQERRGQ